MNELDKKFDFKTIDEKWTSDWAKSDVYHAKANPNKKPYTIVIPPPNVTGILHMGHALNNTLQDIIIRYKRMNGFETLWMPGTDHAGIATQNVVEKALAKEGKKRQDLGREKFNERLWAWKKEYGDTIIHQLEKLGASCDWKRTRFTMDEGYSRAVRTVFIELYEKGLIYQGKYIVNWCPRCHTALSDEEAEHQEHQGTLTHIKYPFKDDPKKFVTVATTRPETMLGDTAVAVNPKDKRYKNLIGKTLILPLVNREIKIIADDFVDPKFGTGAVKVTPAHDPNDFQMGQRHNLEFINIMHPDGRINENGGEFDGLDRFEARKKVVAALKEADAFEKQEDHTHAVGHCYRCDTVVEPYLSKQWFVKMAPLAEPALKVVQEGKVKFYPTHWTKVYTEWMENIRDWCISRQIWWGHRIPVWYDDQGNHYVAHTEEEAQDKATDKRGEIVPLMQDPDVMDTWFSSWLWPFATLDWPEENEDLKFFYPGDSLFTASEIIFFWVARMIMAGLEFRGDIPFKDVYIHGTVRDSKGRKMSKSLGNALDPLEIINEYGVDALRFSLIINSGTDLFISKEKFEIGRNFANKIWNASRLILMNVKEVDSNYELPNPDSKNLDLASQWIISKLNATIQGVSKAIETYKYSEAESLIYEFFWNNFCDWYLEIIKNRWGDTTVQNIALKVLEQSLQIMHPFMPVVTEEVWSNLNKQTAISVSDWPQSSDKEINTEAVKSMQTIIEIIQNIRNIRAQWNISPKEKIVCHLASSNKNDQTLLNDNAEMIKGLNRLSDLHVEKELSQTKNSAAAVIQNISLAIPLGDLIDVESEKKKITNQIAEQEKFFNNLNKRLSNESFINKAPADIVAKEKEKLAAIESKIEELKSVAASFE